MRAHNRGLVGAIGVTAAVLGLAGCGSGGDGKTLTPGTSGAVLEIGGTINYGSFGTTADIDCAEGKSVNIGGSNNTLNVMGTCDVVSIGGADNKVTFDQVDDSITVVGINNKVTYRNGDPTVKDTGTENSIEKR